VGGRCHLLFDGQPREESLYFEFAQIGRVAHSVEVDEGANPIQIGLLRTDAEVAGADLLAHGFQQALGAWRGRRQR
jgi:hypothetical protein